MAIPPPRRYSKSHFRRIYRQRADFETTDAEAVDASGDVDVSVSASSVDSASVSISADWSAETHGVAADASSSVGSSEVGADFTGIPVATSTPNLSDYLPASSAGASYTLSADDARVTGSDTVPPSTSGIEDSVVASLLAATTSFSNFQYTSYVATSTSSSVAAKETDGNGYWDEIEEMANSKAKEMMGQYLPTLTLEVILEPTQVSHAPA